MATEGLDGEQGHKEFWVVIHKEDLGQEGVKESLGLFCGQGKQQSKGKLRKTALRTSGQNGHFKGGRGHLILAGAARASEAAWPEAPGCIRN